MTSITNNTQDIKPALERYSKEELVDLMAHILRIYVLNEEPKLETKLSKPETVRELSGLSFPQILNTLKNSMELDELDRFRVTPYTIYVRIGEMEFDLNGPTPVLSAPEPVATTSAGYTDEELDNMSPAERLDAVDTKPWRTNYVAPQAPVSKVETPSMAELFANDKPGERAYNLSLDAPSRFDEPEEEEEAPIADFAPGDVAETSSGGDSDFAKAAQSREDDAPPPEPPPLAEGDSEINPSNRFSSLDLD